MENAVTKYGVYIEGRFQETDASVDILAPYDGARLATVGYASYTQALAAVEYAEGRFAAIRDTENEAIVQGLSDLYDLLSQALEDVAQTIALEAGKPIVLARAELERGLTVIQDGIAAAKAFGQDQPLDLNRDGYTATTRRFPMGVIYGITPFNFPLNLLLHKLIPAIASKNLIIIKPGVQTPVTALKLAELIEKSSLPTGMCQIFPCENDVAQTILENPRVRCLSFTGSTGVGRYLQSLVPSKKVLLECGGMASMIVDETADVEAAATAAVNGGFAYAGQTCISVQHVYIHESVYEQIKAIILAKTQGLKYGDPLDETVSLSSLISDTALEKVQGMVADALEHGATCAIGGKADGRVYVPTVLETVPQAARIMEDEVFGPVICLHRYETISAVVAAINASDFGLQHGVFSKDEALIERLYSEIEVGGFIVNESPTWRVDSMPYGGVKASGNTKEGVPYTVEELSELKLFLRKT